MKPYHEDSLSHQTTKPQASGSTSVKSVSDPLDTPSLTIDGIASLLERPDVVSGLSSGDRSDLLPHLFKIRGQPFSLKDYPQFKTMYSRKYVPDTIYKAARQVGKCASARTTYVSLANGKRVIVGDVKVGDKVLSKDESDRTVVRTVTDKFDRGVKDLIRIKTRMGSTFDLAKEHRMFVFHCFKPAGEFQVGTRIATPRRGGVFNNIPVDPTRIVLAADLIGDLVPGWVFDLNREDTVLFLSRLWATGEGGNCYHKGLPSGSYRASSEHLIGDIRALLLKFGAMATIRQDGTNYELKVLTQEDQDGYLQDALSGGDIVWDKIVSIESIGKEQTYDLEIEGDHNFVANFLISHNSLNLSRSEVLDMVTIPHLQILYVSPLQQQTQRYSTLYMTEAIQSCDVARMLQSKEMAVSQPDYKIVKAVGHQAFANGSGIQLTYAKTSSDRARGIYADRIDFDEIQDQLTDNIPIVSESLTASKYGIRNFTGTAKTTDNTIEHLWQQSSQSEWAMPCTACNYWNFPTEDGRVLDMLQADGIHCVKCGVRLNVRVGEWVPAWPERVDEFLGYHIPQIIIPAIVDNHHNWAKITRKLLRLPLPIIMQEVLGISHSLGSRVISQRDIDRQSTLPTVAELQKQLKRYALTVSGVDWGGAEQSSFTVHTIIGVRPDGKLDVLWARRFIGFNPDEMLSEIARAHKFYKCTMMAADYGMGFDKNVMLEQRFGITMIQIMYVRQNRLLSYSPTLGQHRWTVDKTTALEILFLAIKYGKIFFPPQSEFALYTADLLSPYEEVSESGGMTYRHFVRNPARPDDFCHALNFAAMLAMRLVNSSIMDLIPQTAFSGGETKSGAPAVVDIDPVDVLAAMQT